MASTLTLSLRRQFTRRRARTVLTVATIAAAVTVLWLFAVPTLIDRAMQDRIESDRLWDVRISPNAMVLTDADVDALRTIPNVAGVEARTTAATRFLADDRESRAWLIGVDDFSEQEVNAVLLSEGNAPGPGQVVTDPQNSRTGRYTGGVGDRILLGDQLTTVSGVGGSLEFSATVDDADAVFYLPLADLQDVLGLDTVTWIDIRVDNHDPVAVAATVEAVRNHLSEVKSDVSFWDVPQIREPGSWPEKDSFDNVIRLTFVIAALGLVSAALMVYTTMNTIVREQTWQIGVLRAIGGTRRRIALNFVRMAALMGAIGTAAGVVAGVLLSNLLVGFAGRQFSGVEAGFGVPMPVLVLSFAVGIGGTILSTAPAIRRATAISPRESLVDHGIHSSTAAGRFDAVLRPTSFLPRSFRLGVRNATRQKGRSAATAAQIGFAVGTAIGFLALGITVMTITEQSFDGEGGDIWVRGTGDAAAVLEDVPGVAEVVPVFYSTLAVDSDIFGLQGQTPNAEDFHDHLRNGRWFTQAEENAAAPVTVLGPAAARQTGAAVGETVTVEALTGTAQLEVVGVDTLMVDDGEVLYTPLSTAIELAGGGVPGNYFLLTADDDEAFIDRVARDVQQSLDSSGLGGQPEIRYVEREATLSQSRTIIAMLMILGVPVIALGMIGLANTMTTNIIERTRELGVLRSVGARGRHIRRMIRAEALVLGTVGWLLAIPIGYGIGLLLTELMSNGFGVDFELLFPMWPIGFALIATLAMTALVVAIPVRRAVRLQVGAALRYE